MCESFTTIAYQSVSQTVICKNVQIFIVKILMQGDFDFC